MNTSTKRKIGRPNRLSRNAILETALEMLEEQHGRDLSMRKLAERLQVTPPSLYGYFKDKHSLMQAMANRCFSGFTDAIDFSQYWDQVLCDWLNHLRDSFKRDPSRILLAGLMSTSAEGLAELDKITNILQKIFSAEESAVLQAQSLLWMVLSFATFEIRALDPDIIGQLKRQNTNNAASVTSKHLAIDNYDAMWEQTLQRNIAGLRALAGR